MSFRPGKIFWPSSGGWREINPRLIELSLAAMLRVLASFHDMAPTGRPKSDKKE